MTSPNIRAVVYTDGSARPNNPSDGFMGCGIHGYEYDADVVPKHTHKAAQGNIITTTGYYPEKEAKDTIVAPLRYFDIALSPRDRGTNNQAELLATLHALTYLLARPDIKSIYHKVDSEYVRKGLIEYIPRWLKTNWTDIEGKPISNKELWVDCHSALETMKARGITYSVHWVRGNDTIVGNMQADYLSVVGMNRGRMMFYRGELPTGGIHRGKIHGTTHESPAQGYWNADVERHPFINFRRLYFNTQDVNKLKGRFFLSDPGVGDTYIGNRDPQTAFAVVNIKTSGTIIDLVRDKHSRVVNDCNLICMMNLDRVYSKTIYGMLSTYGEYALLKDNKTRNLNFVDDLSVSQEMNPSRLAPRALDCFKELEGVLEYMDSNPTEESHKAKRVLVKDITGILYETDEKGKNVLKKEYVVGFKALSVPITRTSTGGDLTMDFNVPLIMGLDMPVRNNLKRLESSNPRVQLFTWASGDYCLRYCIYMSCSEGSGVWSNYFCDRMFFIDRNSVKKPK